MKKIHFFRVLSTLLVLLLSCAFVTVAKGETVEYTYQTLPDGNIRLYGYRGSSAHVIVPTEIDGKSVTEIGNRVFSDCDFIQSVVINEGVKKIGEAAFESCDALVSVSLPESLLEIGMGAFDSCKKLSQITLPDKLRTIGVAAFDSCVSLNQIVIPGSVEEIGGGAFLGSGLQTVVIQDGVPYISNRMFSNCEKLSNIALPDSVTGIGESAFQNCDALTSVELGKGLKVIGEDAFLHCDELSQITIPASVTDVGQDAFSSCQNLGDIRILSRNARIQKNAFRSTKFYDDQNNWKKKVLYLDAYLIHAKSDLSASYSVADGTVGIADDGLLDCNDLTTLVLPASVKIIGKLAVPMNEKLEMIRYQGSREQWNAIDIHSENEDIKKALLIFENAGADHEHVLGEWQVEKKASAAKDGMKIACCTVCSVVMQQKIIHQYLYAANLFADCRNTDWYVKNGSILYVYENGLFKGVGKEYFAPEQPMERAMFVTVLGRMHGVKVKGNVTTPFVDVTKGQYYTGYVKWANEQGIVNGISKDAFAPNEKITREQICTMLLRYCDYAKIKIKKVNAPITFTDADRISPYARAAVRHCQTGGIINGEKVGGSYCFRPEGSATRAEVATIMMNFCKTYS